MKINGCSGKYTVQNSLKKSTDNQNNEAYVKNKEREKVCT